MDRPSWHKILSDLSSSWVRSLLVVASITVGLFAIGVIATTYFIIREDIRQGYAAINPANILIKTSIFDKDLVEHFHRLAGVKQAEGVRLVSLRVAAEPGKWNAIAIKGIPDLANMPIDQVKLLSGSWPPSNHEIALDQHRLNEIHAHLGDPVTVEIGSNRYRALKVVAIVQDQTIGVDNSGGGYFTAPIQGYINQETLEWLGIPTPYDGVNMLYITATGNNEDTGSLKTLAARVSEAVKQSDVQVIYSTVRSSNAHPNRDVLDAVTGILVLLGFLVVGLSGVLITNTLQALMKQQTQQIGILKTVGARRLQVSSIYMISILIYGLLSFLISVPLSYWAAYRLLNFVAFQTNLALQGERIVPAVIGLQLFLALFVPQAAALVPIWQGSRLSVIDALNGSSGSRAPGSGRLDGWVSNIRRLSRPMRISIRNVFRNQGRLSLTLLVLTLAGAIFIATFNVRISMANYIDQISHYFLADVSVSTNQSYRIQEMQQILGQVAGVKRVEGWINVSGKLVLNEAVLGDRVAVSGFPVGSSLIEPVILQGRWLEPGDHNALVLSDAFHNAYPEVKIGDQITLHLNDEDDRWQVIGFCQIGGKMGGLTGYTDYDSLAKRSGLLRQANSFRIVATQAKTEVEQQSLAHTVEAELKAKKIAVGDINTASRINNNSARAFSTLTAFLLFMASLIAIVGSIGLAGTMSMNVMERTREIGILRAIGASDRTLMQMVMLEGLIIGLLSFVLAAALSFPISKIMADGVNMALFGATARIGITPTGFIIWLVLIIVLSTVASLLPARNASRLTIREVLAYE